MSNEKRYHPEILRLFGQIDDQKVVGIIELQPTSSDLEVAAAYMKGMDDVMGEERRPLAGNAAKIFEILNRDEDLLEEEVRPK
jgi:hypothetical protein